MADPAAKDVVITPQMIEAGVDRFRELLEAGTSSAYLVEAVVAAALDASRLGTEPK